MSLDVKLIETLKKDYKFEVQSAQRGGVNVFRHGVQFKSEKKYQEFVFDLPDDLLLKLRHVSFKDFLEALKSTYVHPVATDQYALADKIPLVDYSTTSRDIAVYLPKKNKVSELTYESVCATFGHLEKKHKPLWPVELGSFTYDPSEKSGRLDDYLLDDGREIISINLYNKPNYHVQGNSLCEAKLHPELEFFFNHLFDYHEPTIEYVFDYITSILRGERVIGFLHLVSSRQGNGKSTFFKVIEALVGLDNNANLPPNFFSRRFNSQARHKQYCNIEEVHIKEDGIPTFKACTSDEGAQFERKGKDIEKSEKNTTSWGGSSNERRHQGLDYEARRNVIPNITNVKLSERLTSYSEKEWFEGIFIPLIKDPDVLLQTYKFFVNREKTHKLGSAIKTFNFYQTKRECLIPQERAILDALIDLKNDRPIDFKEFNKMIKTELEVAGMKIKNRAVTEQKFENFVKNFEWRGIVPIAELRLTVNSTGAVSEKIYEVVPKIGIGAEFDQCIYDKEGLWVDAIIEEEQEELSYI